MVSAKTKAYCIPPVYEIFKMLKQIKLEESRLKDISIAFFEFVLGLFCTYYLQIIDRELNPRYQTAIAELCNCDRMAGLSGFGFLHMQNQPILTPNVSNMATWSMALRF